jgi:hypothetical protein
MLRLDCSTMAADRAWPLSGVILPREFGRANSVTGAAVHDPTVTSDSGRHLVHGCVMSTDGQAHCEPESRPKIGDLPKSPTS